MSFPGYPGHEISFSRSPGFELRLADHPAFSRSPGVSGFRSPGAAKCRFQITQHGEMSFPGYPTRRNVVPRLPGSRNFFSRSPGSGIHDCVIQANEAGDSEWELSLGPSAAGARSLDEDRGARSRPGKLKREICAPG